jgi:hypothetical protein
MLEIVWTRRAGDHLQRVFSELDAIAPTLAEAWTLKRSSNISNKPTGHD